jgi:hypothetical protein
MNAPAEFPLTLRPFCLELCLTFARMKLGRDLRLVAIGSAAIGLAGDDHEWRSRVYRAGIRIDRQTNQDDVFHGVPELKRKRDSENSNRDAAGRKRTTG